MRRWRKGLLDSGVSAVTTAKAYRLLKAIMNTAVDDGLIRRNPCRIKGAGQERSPERPTLTIPQVYALAEAIDQRYRALVLLGTFGSLRWGELAALRRGDIDLTACTVSVDRQLTETIAGKPGFGPPKSEAGRRRRIWHESGTAAAPGLVSARITQTDMASELEFPVSAPGRTRTCDPLLRRQLLYPTELRAPGTTLCMPKVTCRPQAG